MKLPSDWAPLLWLATADWLLLLLRGCVVLGGPWLGFSNNLRILKL